MAAVVDEHTCSTHEDVATFHLVKRPGTIVGPGAPRVCD
jgi:hypothetical protein